MNRGFGIAIIATAAVNQVSGIAKNAISVRMGLRYPATIAAENRPTCPE